MKANKTGNHFAGTGNRSTKTVLHFNGTDTGLFKTGVHPGKTGMVTGQTDL